MCVECVVCCACYASCACCVLYVSCVSCVCYVCCACYVYNTKHTPIQYSYKLFTLFSHVWSSGKDKPHEDERMKARIHEIFLKIAKVNVMHVNSRTLLGKIQAWLSLELPRKAVRIPLELLRIYLCLSWNSFGFIFVSRGTPSNLSFSLAELLRNYLCFPWNSFAFFHETPFSQFECSTNPPNTRAKCLFQLVPRRPRKP